MQAISLRQIFYQLSEVERQLGDSSASDTALRICNSICTNASEAIQLACAIEAFEDEPYRDWPSTWILSRDFLTVLLQEYEFAMNMEQDRPCRFLMRQRMSYALLNHPTSFDDRAIILQGLTEVLDLNDENRFIEMLMDAGKRKAIRGDELDAESDEKILHVAMTYRHSSHYTSEGTISSDTAKEAFKVLQTIQRIEPEIKGVRIWIDQNLHRYPNASLLKKYSKTFHSPFTQLLVVCSLPGMHGFGIIGQRPLIWLEMNMGFECYGLCYAKGKETCVAEALGISSKRSQALSRQYDIGIIVGKVSKWRTHATRAMEILSFWAPGMFQYEQYPFLDSILEDAKTARKHFRNDPEILTHFKSESNVYSKDEYINSKFNLRKEQSKSSLIGKKEERNIFDIDVKHIAFDIYINRGVWMHGLFEGEIRKHQNGTYSHSGIPQQKKNETILIHRIGDVHVSDIIGASGASAFLVEVFGKNYEPVFRGLQPKNSKTCETTPQFTNVKNLGSKKNVDSEPIIGPNCGFSLWDSRMGRGIPTQMSTCGRVLEHFIESVYRMGTVAIGTRGHHDRPTIESEKYVEQFKRLVTRSTGTQTLLHKCEMEFVTRLPESLRGDDSSSTSGQAFVDIDLNGAQSTREEDVGEHPRIIRPRSSQQQ